MLKNMFKPDDFKKKIGGAKTEIFTPLLETDVIYIPFNRVGKNINEIIKNKLVDKIEGKCMKDGFVEPGSTNIITISSGTLVNSDVKYIVAYQAMVCFPVENMVIECTAKNITKAGIKAIIVKYSKTPMIIFVARDHHYNNDKFNSIEENDVIRVKIIGQRFELNDEYISVIAEML
jgi:DNA-directed RNA polymerase subunit E'/Rpb7